MAHVFSFLLAALVLSTAGCASMSAHHQSMAARYNPRDGSPHSVELVMSRTKGLVNAHFSSRLTPTAYYMRDTGPGSASRRSDREYFRNAEFVIHDPLPPGLRLNTNRRVIEGTPTSIGQWHVKIWYRDRERKHLTENRWYTRSVEIRIFSKLTEE